MVLSVRVAEPRKTVKQKDVVQAVVVRQVKPFRRKDGSYISFNENAVVILEKGKRSRWPDEYSALFPARSVNWGTRKSFHWHRRSYKYHEDQKGDTVVIITGKDKGKEGKVVRSFPVRTQVIVEGMNLKKKHQRARRQGQKGQIVEFAAPMHVSNVSLKDPKTGSRHGLG